MIEGRVVGRGDWGEGGVQRERREGRSQWWWKRRLLWRRKGAGRERGWRRRSSSTAARADKHTRETRTSSPASRSVVVVVLLHACLVVLCLVVPSSSSAAASGVCLCSDSPHLAILLLLLLPHHHRLPIQRWWSLLPSPSPPYPTTVSRLSVCLSSLTPLPSVHVRPFSHATSPYFNMPRHHPRTCHVISIIGIDSGPSPLPPASVLPTSCTLAHLPRHSFRALLPLSLPAMHPTNSHLSRERCQADAL